MAGETDSAYPADLRSHTICLARHRTERPVLRSIASGSSVDAVGLIFLSLKPCQGSYFNSCMIPRLLTLLALLSIAAAHRTRAETNANRLTYLDETDPFCVGLTFPKLTTPQWVGEP